MKRIRNCENCGAILDYTKEIVKCDYCKTIYSDIKNKKESKKEKHYKAINYTDEIVTLEILGEKRKFYIGEMEMSPVYCNTYRFLDGSVHYEAGDSKMTIKLIEL